MNSKNETLKSAAYSIQTIVTCGLRLPGVPHRSTEWQIEVNVISITLRQVNVDFLNKTRGWVDPVSDKITFKLWNCRGSNPRHAGGGLFSNKAHASAGFSARHMAMHRTRIAPPKYVIWSVVKGIN